MDGRIAQITTAISLMIDRDKSMLETLRLMRSYLDGKWSRPQTQAEVSVLLQLDQFCTFLEASIRRHTDLAEGVRSLLLPELRRVEDDETIS